MVLLKIIFIAFAIYYLLKSVGRFLLPALFRNIQQNTGSRNGGYYQNKREGEVTIQNQSKKNNNYSKNIGEYVDFEEIKDE